MAKFDYSNLEIDLMKLYTESTTDKWNCFLDDCFNKRNIERLMNTRCGIQVGMDTLVKNKLNSPQMCEWFVRINRSIEITAKKIIKILNPMPTDSGSKSKIATAQWIEAKRRRDQEFEAFMLKSSY